MSDGQSSAGTPEAPSFEMLAALVERSPYGFFRLDAAGSCEYVNDHWCRLAGLTPESALGDGWRAAVHPDDLATVLASLERAALGDVDEGPGPEYRFLHADGTVRWVEGFATSFAAAPDGSSGRVGMCLDVTDRKETEEALMRSSERFRVAFDNAPIGVALLTPDGRWFHVNQALCDLLGYTSEELCELTFVDLTHPDDLAANLERSRKQLQGDEWETRIEKRYIRADGQVVWVALSNEVVHDTKGEPLYFVAQIEDITQRRETERALREAEELFRRAFDDAPIGMALVSPDGHWLRVNATTCEILGYAEAELLQRTFQEITHPDDVETGVERTHQLLTDELRAYQIEKRYVQPDGEIVWAMVSVSLVRDDDGVPLYFVAQIEDIRERKRVESELQRLAGYDPLTGLGNRRRLTTELERALGPDNPSSHLLVVFDLNGFKQYNDSFGHPAGDALLARLAAKLSAAAEPYGEAFRLGGDEFCVLGSPPAGEVAGYLDATTAALEEKGDGFNISSAFGAIFLPDDAADPSAALSLADERLYAQKHTLHAMRGQPHDILLRAIYEREPRLREHIDEVAVLSVAVGQRIGLADDALAELRLAAELHDVGKLAIPDAILQKQQPLTENEWRLMRQHTVVGQRILAAAPALRGIGAIVRSTHENWDGSGYADGLVGEEIPLPARIISMCDAYVAMTTDRPYRAAISTGDAIAELRRCAGRQFDPALVPLLCDALETRSATEPPSAARASAAPVRERPPVA
jgi:PAS domain S-box-containing protein/diguanylate cyclase (GGDEF)-like protein